MLEVVVVLLVVGVLLSLAVPSYQRYALRGQRVEAIRIMMTIADCLERKRAVSGYYDNSACIPVAESEHYDFRIDPQNESAALEFTITATPAIRHRDDLCGALGLDHVGTRSCEGGPDQLPACWGGR